MEECKKKLPITAFPCRCGNQYCELHRSDVVHKCTFDYKKENINYLSTTLIKVISKQVEVI